MSDSPFIKFYPSDFLGGTSGLSPAERGVYITLLCLIYEADGPIPRDDARLSRRCGAPKAAFIRILEGLIDEGKITDADGMLSNRRAEKALMDRANRSQNSTHAANQRWSAQAEKTPQKQSANDAAAMPPQCVADASQKPEPEVAVAVAARAPESPSLREQVMAAAGVPSSRAIPTHWMPPAADLHCRRWVTDLGLTEAEIIDVAKASRARHADPPGSPKAFDHAMKHLALQKSAPAMQPTNGPANEHSRPHRRTAADADRAAAEARQALADGRITSVIAGPFAPGASRRR